MPNRVLICGGRVWTNRQLTFTSLDAHHEFDPIDVVIHGAAKGADSLAGEWAKSRDIPILAYPVSKADWERLGWQAGHLRNQQMLDEAKPNLVIAFPGRGGTADMKKRAAKAGVPVKLLP